MKDDTKITRITKTPRLKIRDKEYAIQIETADRIANNEQFVSDGDKLAAWKGSIGARIILFHNTAKIMSIELDYWELASKALNKKSKISKLGTSRQVAKAKGNVLEGLDCAISELERDIRDVQTRLAHWENLRRIIAGYDEESAFEFLIRVSGFRSNV